MNTIDSSTQAAMRTQLIQRRELLNGTIAETPDSTRLVHLLKEVDAALKRIDAGAYGICEVCNEPIEQEHLQWDPLVKVCLEHLSETEQRAIQRDLDLASQIQTTLLPARHLHLNGWDVSFEYIPAGVVSGDYCDIVRSETEPGVLYFFLGDVSGKGVAASLLMSHLHAIFRSLVDSGLSLDQMTARANRLFCESTMAAHFATLVSGRASGNGKIEICNAGHLPAMHLHNATITAVEGGGLPIGLFCNQGYTVRTLILAPRDSLILYTDGLTESRNSAEMEYGASRLKDMLLRHHTLTPEAFVGALTRDEQTFRSGAPRADDLTIMVLRRSV
jgi:sigma-B regulation protein RsbU (phosphoserine phosphatase)